MGQIMKYWNYPVYQVVRGGQQFDWCNMPDKLYYFNSDYEKQRNAIAHLLKDCGTAAGMNYCSNACMSGAYDENTRDALVNGFGYSSDAILLSKNNYSISFWKLVIKGNLSIGLPVYYSGFGKGKKGGHAFVCDGYGSDDLFHFNWGWGGNYDDDWFTIDNLTPGDEYNFNLGQAAIFNISPNISQNYCNYSLSLAIHYSLYYNIFGFTSPPPYQNVPKTFNVLESVPEGQGYPASWRTIESGQSAEYVAHESITLLPGFTAEAGSTFVARIEPCPNCNSATVTVKKLENGVEIEEELYIAVGDNEKEQLLDKDKTAADELLVYPNPTTGLLTIHAKNENSRIQMIELYNTQGTKLFTFSGSHGAFQEIDISHLPSQVYVLKIQMNEQLFTKKLILQK
jgi:hypothetical protein